LINIPNTTKEFNNANYGQGIIQEYATRTKTWTSEVQLIIYDRIIKTKTNTKLITKVAVLVTVIGI
jgi:hypothetical protein